MSGDPFEGLWIVLGSPGDGRELEIRAHLNSGAEAKDETRNRLILSDVVASLQEGRSPMVLTERRDFPHSRG